MNINNQTGTNYENKKNTGEIQENTNLELENKEEDISNNEEAHTSEVDPKLLEEFKNDVKIFLTIDDEIKIIEKQLKEKREKKKNLTSHILSFMENHNIQDLNTDTGTLQRNVSYTKQPLNKKTLQLKLLQYFKNNELETKTALDFINNRGKEEKIKLKRLVSK